MFHLCGGQCSVVIPLSHLCNLTPGVGLGFSIKARLLRKIKKKTKTSASNLYENFPLVFHLIRENSTLQFKFPVYGINVTDTISVIFSLQMKQTWYVRDRHAAAPLLRPMSHSCTWISIKNLSYRVNMIISSHFELPIGVRIDIASTIHITRNTRVGISKVGNYIAALVA